MADKVERYRSRGAFPSVNTEYNQYQYLWDTCARSSWGNSGGTYLMPVGEFQEMNDQVIPDYHKRRARGEFFFNAMQRHTMVHTRNSGVGSWRKNTVPINCSGVNRFSEIRETLGITDLIYASKKGLSTSAPIPPTPLHSDADISHLVTELSTELQNNRGRSDTNLWESIAEADKSFVLLAELFSQLKTLVVKAKRDSVRKHANAASSLWLLYRYGLGPLVSDIAGVVKGLSELTGKRRETLRVKGSLWADSSETLTSSSATVTRVIKAVYYDRVMVRLMTLDEYSASVGFNLGFSLKGLITLPWELIRLSFVVDWFANVGNYLGALVPAVGATQLGSALAIERIRSTNLMPVGDFAAGTYVPVRSQTATFLAVDTLKTRSVGLPAPGLLIKGDFRFQKLNRCLDSLALLQLALGGLSIKAKPPRKPKWKTGDTKTDWADGSI